MAWTGKGVPLRADEWEVRTVGQAVAERLVQRFHYAAGVPNACTYLHGLFPKDSFWEQDCRGIAWWLPPIRGASLAAAGERWEGVLALSRLVVEEGMPGNAASFLMASSMRLIDRERWHTLLTFADSWRGHKGSIYKATGWREAGLTRPTAVYTLNGRMVSQKSSALNRTHEDMLAMGARFEGKFRKIRFVSP